MQYPDALPLMMGDLKQIRRFSHLLQKTEIKFDLLSAVDELAAQVQMEFNFKREAKIMDAIADNLKAGPHNNLALHFKLKFSVKTRCSSSVKYKSPDKQQKSISNRQNNCLH